MDAEFFAIVTDLVGAPSELVDETGGLVWRARRTIWGAPVAPDQAGPVRLRFRGQYADRESGLCYNRFRYYEPGTGRYTSPDPLGLAAAPKPAAYVDNPTTTIDPLGLAPCAPAGVVNSGGVAHGPENPGYCQMTWLARSEGRGMKRLFFEMTLFCIVLVRMAGRSDSSFRRIHLRA